MPLFALPIFVGCILMLRGLAPLFNFQNRTFLTGKKYFIPHRVTSEALFLLGDGCRLRSSRREEPRRVSAACGVLILGSSCSEPFVYLIGRVLAGRAQRDRDAAAPLDFPRTPIACPATPGSRPPQSRRRRAGEIRRPCLTSPKPYIHVRLSLGRLCSGRQAQWGLKSKASVFFSFVVKS